jgi:soluble cytochrome b562
MKMDKGGVMEEFVVEIKPKAQLQKPKAPKRKTAKALKNFQHGYETYVRNLCKTEALNKMAKLRNFKVMLLTEDSKLF